MNNNTWRRLRIASTFIFPFPMLLFLLGYRYYISIKTELLGVNIWYRISLGGKWEEAIETFYNIIIEGNFDSSDDFGMFIPILIIGGQIVLWVSWTLMGSYKPSNPKRQERMAISNYGKYWRGMAVVVILSAITTIVGLSFFIKFTQSVGSFDAGDYSFSFYFCFITCVVGVIIAIITLINPGDYEEDILERERVMKIKADIIE
ncbi:MAG: hypothetical protein ACTSR1_02140 [Candidatus Heimdallarchaeota archaeon]